jgi:polyisoprenoid-binding protein YceI
MKALKLIALASILAASCGGKKKDDNKDTTTTTTTTPADAAGAGTGSAPDTGSGSAMAGSGSAGEGSGSAMAGSGSAAEPDADADYITVLAEHKEKKEGDPVRVSFKKFAVTKANFDPAKIEGGTATIELDGTSIESGAPKRDTHLQSADYLNVPKFAKVTIDISDVKKKADKTYTAKAKIQAVGVTKTYPVTFDVVDAKDDWVKIKGEHKFKRTDFKVGKAATDKDESVADDLTIQLQLTLKKT